MVTGTWLQPERSEYGIPGGTKTFSLLQHVKTGSGAHSAPYFLHTEDLSRGQNLLGAEISTHIRVVLRFNVIEVMQLISLRTFTEWTDTAMTFYLYFSLGDWLKLC